MPLIPIPEDRAAWLALRGGYVGASEVAALFGMQPQYARGIWALWQVKAGRAQDEFDAGPRAAWGLRLEEAIATAAAEREGWDVRPGMFAIHEDCHGMAATLDRIIAAPTAEERERGWTGPGVLELKSVDWLTHRGSWGEEPPTHILLQLQAQLACTGYQWGAFAALVGGNDLHIYRYGRRPKIIAAIESRVESFWASVRAGKTPAPDGSDATFRVLRELHPTPADEPADLTDDNEAPVLAAEVLRLAAERKAIEKQEADAKAALLVKLGDHRAAMLRGFRISQAITPEKPPTPITAEMIGQSLPGRAESRRLIVKEKAA
jgi:putative phage-type endonuclease